MRLTIKLKFLIVMLLLAVVPLLGVMLWIRSRINNTSEVIIANIESIGDVLVEEASEALDMLGQGVIEQKARDVAKQVELYISTHPEMTVEELQDDIDFRKIAVQPIGETGYTALTDVDTLTARMHISPEIENLRLEELSDKLPGFWEIMSVTRGGKTAAGYYDWKDPDGTTRPKYMYIAIVDAKTADNVVFSVAATTYIDEFSRAALLIEKKVERRSGELLSEIEDKRDVLFFQLLYGGLFVVLVVVIAAFLFARSLLRPIKKLTKTSQQVAMGKFDQKGVELKIRGGDEITELTESIDNLIRAHKKGVKSATRKKK